MSTRRSRSDSTPKLPTAARNPWGRLMQLGMVALLAVAVGGLCVAWLVPRHVGGSFAAFPLEELGVGRPQYYRPFNLGFDAGGRPYALFLVRTTAVGAGDTEVLALFSRDPHELACSVALAFDAEGGPAGLAYHAACSGSRFTADGTRLEGPSPRALDRFAVEVDGATVRIELTELILGECATAPGAVCSTPARTRTQPIDWPGN